MLENPTQTLMTNRPMLKWLLLLLLVMLIAFILIGASQYRQIIDEQSQSQAVPQTTTPPEPVPDFQRVDFGTNVPEDFPTDIPIETGSNVEQSYGLSYVGQKQLTIVFLSTKTVAENYTLYTDFLKEPDWIVSNKYESPTLSSLYGTKENNDINITISEDTETGSKSQVSISVLKK